MSFTELRVDALEIITKLCHGISAAEQQLINMLRAGGFIAGGSARAAVLWAHNKSLDVNSQYEDVDVYFDCSVAADALLSGIKADSEWVTHEGYNEVHTGADTGSHKRWFTRPLPEVQQHRLEVKSSSHRDAVVINVISFKRGTPVEILRTFDILNVQCAVTRDRVVLGDEVMALERAHIVKLAREELAHRAHEAHIHKSLSRLGKYLSRARSLYGSVLSDEDIIEFFLSVMSSEDVAGLARTLTQLAMHELALTTPFEHRLKLAMILWPEHFVTKWDLLSIRNPNWK